MKYILCRGHEVGEFSPAVLELFQCPRLASRLETNDNALQGRENTVTVTRSMSHVIIHYLNKINNVTVTRAMSHEIVYYLNKIYNMTVTRIMSHVILY